MSARQSVLQSIRGKLLVSFSLLVTSIAVFVYMFFPARLEHQAMQAVMAKAVAISDITAYSLSAGVYFGDSASVSDVLAGAARAPGIEVLVVRDSAERIVAMRRAGGSNAPSRNYKTGTRNDEDSLYVVDSPITHADKRIGRLTVAISLATVRKDVAKARQLGSLVGLLIFLIGFAIVYAISTLVTRPLTAVSRTVERIAAGDLTLRAVETSDAEVTQLVRAFNRMVDNLAGAQFELSQNNAQLEMRVEVRTSELREAVADQRQARLAAMQSETQARATSATLESLIDVAPQAIIAVDLEWNVTLWNNAAEQLFGWTAEEVLGTSLPIIPDHGARIFSERAESDGNGRRSSVIECVRMRKDGTLITVLLSASSLRDSEQQPVGFIAVITDLTERKSLEGQLRQSQKMEAIGRLAGGVAHDFNNMLTVITQSASYLLENVTNPAQSEDLEAIATAALRASALTRQLLMFSRKEVVNPVRVCINDVVDDMRLMLRRLVRENIQFQTRLDSALGLVVADSTQLQQAIMNLVVNASDAMPDGGVLTIETSNVDLDEEYAHLHADVKPGPHVQLTISDTGIGMDADTISKIFEPFFTTKAVGVGTGLGLATTYAVVSQLGGHILVYSELGLGTALKIFLPRTAEKEMARRNTPAAVAAVPHSSDGITVLLVEDEPSVREAIRRTLARLGYNTLEAADGETGLVLAALHKEQIDLVLTDLMMPGMNGRTFADRLLNVLDGVPVVFMSGYTDETVNRRGLVDSSHAFLQKPFSSDQLVRTVHQLLQAGAEGRAVGSGFANSSVGGFP